ncbi:hypothetical protein ACN28E_24050 [Archangium lansingense]|uniref:hypothetical protein n=1 Tax=Archangium lansingense TaxID=2995310 RepID=UPI003B7748E0
MDKKAKSSGEELEKLGPYQLHEQVPQDDLSRGELYRATHETSGVTALVLKPASEERAEPLRNWRVRCVSSTSPGYVALEVEDSRWSVAPGKHSVEALTCLFEEVREGVRRMADAFPYSDEPRPWQRLGLVLAGATALGALAFALGHMVSMSQPTDGPMPLTSAASVSHEEAMDTEISEPFTSALEDISPQGVPVLARPLPREPFKGQKRPPCTQYTEVELVGACWMPHELKAPCPNALFEHQGKCYAPVFRAQAPPQSLGQ